MSISLAQNPIAFHISLNVSDIDRSVEFFSKVFGTPPAKHRNDYAKFELQNPPLTLSLEPGSPSERGALNHLGFKLQSAEDLVAFQRRLEMVDIRSEREEGVECCYAKQSKFWLHDSDGTLWEMYVLEGDLEYRGAGQDTNAVSGDGDAGGGGASRPGVIERTADSAAPSETKRQQWTHRLGNSLAIPDEFHADSLDEVALQGTFNGANTLPELGPFLRQVAHRLRAGGRVSLHCLTADRHVEQLPQLPGPASVVKSVPCLDSLIDGLEAAGFEAIRLTKYGSRACFTAGEAELRETMIEARKPAATDDTDKLTVVYVGPLREIVFDNGESLKRGRRTELSPAVVERLRLTTLGDSLLVIETATAPTSCTA